MLLVGIPPSARCQDRARTDGVDADVVGGEFAGEGARRWISAALAAPYWACGDGFQPEIDAMIAIAPPERWRMGGTTARTARTT
ncbi:hypothetical protein FDG2_2739 [Candidatus Protofrankia californiensis]|uniref:Uncharacterized protein n=1 Tax=Candidatus Protofrankia californiensis TaxID=1839754 RepID=A0A1C3NY74_9ACTN|nr:hypothetical protein FDG2_2739 [Candidatus Protofrankia californiensis]